MGETLRRNQSPVGEIQDALDYGYLDFDALTAVLAIVRASKARKFNSGKDESSSRDDANEGMTIHA